MENPRTVVDAITQTMRCNVCKDEVPIPLGSLDWVAAVCLAFDKAHRACKGNPGRTTFSVPVKKG
jgi:hypothetical protein